MLLCIAFLILSRKHLNSLQHAIFSRAEGLKSKTYAQAEFVRHLRVASTKVGWRGHVDDEIRIMHKLVDTWKAWLGLICQWLSLPCLSPGASCDQFPEAVLCPSIWTASKQMSTFSPLIEWVFTKLHMPSSRFTRFTMYYPNSPKSKIRC